MEKYIIEISDLAQTLNCSIPEATMVLLAHNIDTGGQSADLPQIVRAGDSFHPGAVYVEQFRGELDDFLTDKTGQIIEDLTVSGQEEYIPGTLAAYTWLTGKEFEF